MVANVTATDSRDRLLEPSTLALAAIQCVLVAGSLSFGVFPLLVDGLVRLAHFDVQSAGLSVTAEMLGQSIGAAGALAIVRRVGSRRSCHCGASLYYRWQRPNCWSLFIFSMVIVVARGGWASDVVSLWFASDFWRLPSKPTRNFAIFNTAYLVCCALLAAAVPALFRMLGVGGAFAVIAGCDGSVLVGRFR